MLNYAHGCAVFIGWVYFLAIRGFGKKWGVYMGLYMLKNTGKDIEDGIAEKVKSDSIDYECYFESWLQNSPSLLFDDEDDGNTVLWIGRQVTASVGDVGKFPDLIGFNWY